MRSTTNKMIEMTDKMKILVRLLSFHKQVSSGSHTIAPAQLGCWRYLRCVHVTWTALTLIFGGNIQLCCFSSSITGVIYSHLDRLIYSSRMHVDTRWLMHDYDFQAKAGRFRNTIKSHLISRNKLRLIENENVLIPSRKFIHITHKSHVKNWSDNFNC